jgi:hypothetical protein
MKIVSKCLFCFLYLVFSMPSHAITLGEIINPYDRYFADCDQNNPLLQSLCTAVQAEVNARLAQAGLTIDNGDLAYSLDEGMNIVLNDSCSRTTRQTGMQYRAVLRQTTQIGLRGNAISKPMIFGVTAPIELYVRANFRDDFGATIYYPPKYPWERPRSTCQRYASDNYYGDTTAALTAKFSVLLSLEPRFAISQSNHLVIQLQPVVDVSLAADNVNVSNLDFHGVSVWANIAQTLAAPSNFMNGQVEAIFDGANFREIISLQKYAGLAELIGSGTGVLLTDFALGDPLMINNLIDDYLNNKARNMAADEARDARSDLANKLRAKVAAALDLDSAGKVIYAFDFGLNRVEPTQADRQAIATLERGYVYRYYHHGNGEHFNSLSPTEGLAYGYSFEGLAYILQGTQLPGTIPLFRCWYPQRGKHFVSTDGGCEGAYGAINEGTYGYAYSSQVAGTVPLYRFYLWMNGDSMATTNFNEGAHNGYSYEGTLGFVTPP